MLSRSDNELMCRVGRGTPMGEAMRRYWLPACQSSDLPKGSTDPRRIELLGDGFVAFRGDDGSIGFLDEGCCHRGVSLALGRVEGCAIRCIFHGWKFAMDGTLLEAPNVSDERFMQRVRARSYPVREAGGLIWVYLGKAELEPVFPLYSWYDLPERHRLNAYLVENSNYVQVIEALFDSSHLNILHADGLKAASESELDYAHANRPLLAGSAPYTEAEDTDFGFHYSAMRDTVEGTEARIAAFIAPCFATSPIGNLWMAVVPINDSHCVYYHVFWNEQDAIGEEPLRTQQLEFVGLDEPSLAAFGLTHETVGDPDKPSVRNRFRQDRAAMARGETFSGFHSFSQEDAGVIMSAGQIKDRTRENLCPADGGIMRLYRTLLRVAKSTSAGVDPPGLDADPRRIFGLQGVVPAEGWQGLVPTHGRLLGEAKAVAEEALAAVATG